MRDKTPAVRQAWFACGTFYSFQTLIRQPIRKPREKFKNRPEAEVLIGLKQAKIRDHLIFGIVIAALICISNTIGKKVKSFMIWQHLRNRYVIVGVFQNCSNVQQVLKSVPQINSQLLPIQKVKLFLEKIHFLTFLLLV